VRGENFFSLVVVVVVALIERRMNNCDLLLHCPFTFEYIYIFFSFFSSPKKCSSTICILAPFFAESGIPDYRTSRLQRKVINPITDHQFRSDSFARQRYWARGLVGYEKLLAQPNAGHHSLAWLQLEKFITAHVTQNVDGLMQRADISDIIELHGTMHAVNCMSCGFSLHRSEYHRALSQVNADWINKHVPWMSQSIEVRESAKRDLDDPKLVHHQDSGIANDSSHIASNSEYKHLESRPDGDVVLNDEAVHEFCHVPCAQCGKEMMKPDVVFFGGKVPDRVTQATFQRLDDASRILIVRVFLIFILPSPISPVFCFNAFFK
jgi:NAD-dependent SIR2 family protein deacetylase